MGRWLHYISIVLVFSFYQSSTAQIPAGYYDDAIGLSGESLKTALHNIIDDHTELSYASVTNALRVTDEDTINTDHVILIYTGWTYHKNDFGGLVDDWNREHVWSKSHGDFGDDPPAGTDIHHLRPCDVTVNSSKNNRDFSKGVTEYIDGGIPTGCYTDTDIWEPRDLDKGDVARMIFYMAVRYEGDNGEPDLELVSYVNTAPNGEPLYGNFDTLVKWHNQDPVNDWERRRNDLIYSNYQGNRNPFIDHPEYVDLIWGTVDENPETFDVAGYWAGNMSSYGAKTYTNPDNPANDQFSSNVAWRESAEVRSSPYAWRLQQSASAYLRYELEDTIRGFDIYMARWGNSPTPYVTIRYSTNSGSSYTSIESIDGDYFSGDKVYKLYSHNFTVPISPDPSEKIYIEFLTTAGERMLYDDFLLKKGGIEPTTHATVFIASANGFTSVEVEWDDAVPAAQAYLIKGSSVGYASISNPVDGIVEINAELVQNINAGTESFLFTDLQPGTIYYFKIFPYNGTASAVNYKTNGTVPQSNASTNRLDLIISEIADPGDEYDARYVELMNCSNFTIDFSALTFYLCRQANGSGWGPILLSGSISSGESYTVTYNSTFEDEYGFEPDQTNGYITGNGNDGYFLYYDGDQTSGLLIDSYGEANVDGIGEPWYYADCHAVRKRSVASPNAIWTASEWVILAAYVKDMTPGLHKGDFTWQGTTSNWNLKGTSWLNLANPQGFIPDASCYVTISNQASDPVVTEPSACDSLSVESGASLQIQSGKILRVVK